MGELIQFHLLHIMAYAKLNKGEFDKSWPVLLKSNTFFGKFVAYLMGIRGVVVGQENGAIGGPPRYSGKRIPRESGKL